MPPLESIASDARFITFPVTDGDSTRRPENMTPPPSDAGEVNWYRNMAKEERYFCRWRNLVGQGIAKLLDKPGQLLFVTLISCPITHCAVTEKEKYCLKSFPRGYWLFDHHKGPASNIRHDVYLLGEPSILAFY